VCQCVRSIIDILKKQIVLNVLLRISGNHHGDLPENNTEYESILEEEEEEHGKKSSVGIIVFACARCVRGQQITSTSFDRTIITRSADVVRTRRSRKTLLHETTKVDAKDRIAIYDHQPFGFRLTIHHIWTVI